VMHAQGRPSAIGGRDSLPVLLEQRHDATSGIERLVRRLGDSIEEELEPGLPSPALANLLQQAVVVGPMRLEVEAEVEGVAEGYPACRGTV
jgi:hypothetical protein